MNLDDNPYLSGRAELMGTAINPQPDGTTELVLGFELEIPAPPLASDAMLDHQVCA